MSDDRDDDTLNELTEYMPNHIVVVFLSKL